VKRWGIRVFPQRTAADVSFRNLADALGACKYPPKNFIGAMDTFLGAVFLLMR
jgi:hypothetical protein